jgi:hypothetical protein
MRDVKLRFIKLDPHFWTTQNITLIIKAEGQVK